MKVLHTLLLLIPMLQISVARYQQYPFLSRYLGIVYGLTYSDNPACDAVLETYGVNAALREAALSVKPLMKLTYEDGQYTLLMDGKFFVNRFQFQLNIPFLERTVDGKEVVTVFKREGPNTLVQTFYDTLNGNTLVIRRMFRSKFVEVQMLSGGYSCDRLYTATYFNQDPDQNIGSIGSTRN